jgi:hypothetical protein
MTTLINLTPHRVDVHGLTLQPSGQVARCVELRHQRPAVDGIQVTLAEYGDVIDLPDPRPGVFYIVSAIVLMAAPQRTDIFAPGPLIRTAEGHIIGCRGLSCTPAY